METSINSLAEHLRRNAKRFMEQCGSTPDTFKFVECIKQLRSETAATLKDAKDAVDLWRAEGFRAVQVSPREAKLLLKNLLLRASQSGLTFMEVDAIRQLIEE